MEESINLLWKHRIVNALVAVTLCWLGCHSTYELQKTPTRSWLCGLSIPQSIDSTPVYVLNPELATEFEILKNARIYQFVADAGTAGMKVRLLPLQEFKADATAGFIISAFTLGIAPVYYPDDYCFSFELIAHGTIDTIHVPIGIRTKESTFGTGERDLHKLLSEAIHRSLKERQH